MIIPAAEASGMRAMISAFAGWSLPTGLSRPAVPLAAANTNAPFAANDVRGSNGAAAYHYHDHSGRLTPDQIRANKGAFVKMLREAHREFALRPRP
jgi:hypothetical protein